MCGGVDLVGSERGPDQTKPRNGPQHCLFRIFGEAAKCHRAGEHTARPLASTIAWRQDFDPRNGGMLFA